MSSKNKKTVLIVEDSPTQAVYLGNLLALNGLDTICVDNGEEGYHNAIVYLPNVIVLDVELPDMSGLQVCNLLKGNKYTRHIPVILFSSIKVDTAQLGGRAAEVIYISKDEYADKTLLTVLQTKGLIDEIRVEGLLDELYV